jgi:hypothetical protein
VAGDGACRRRAVGARRQWFYLGGALLLAGEWAAWRRRTAAAGAWRLAWPAMLWALAAVPLALLTARGPGWLALPVFATALVLALAGLRVERMTHGRVRRHRDRRPGERRYGRRRRGTRLRELASPALGAGDPVGRSVGGAATRARAPAGPDAVPFPTTPAAADAAAARPGETTRDGVSRARARSAP